MTLNLDAIKARAEAATEGPWRWDEPTDESFPQMEENLWAVNPGADGHPDCVVGSWGYDADGIDASPEDRAFIAHARTDIPALIAEVERLQGIVDRVRKLHAPEVQTVSVPVFDEFDSPTQTDTYCAGCGGWGSSQKLHRLCPTIRALDDQ